MTNLVPLEGDPATLSTYASRYVTIAEAILDTSRRLSAFASDLSDDGKSVSELANRSSSAGSKMLQAHPRYDSTAQALTTYAVRLQEAQDQANTAIADADRADNNLPYYQDKHDDLNMYRPREVITDEEREQRATDLAYVDAQLERIQADTDAAIALYQGAVDYRDAAAQAAIDAISPALDSMNDSVSDYVDAWVGSLPDFLQAIGKWLGDIFVAVVEGLQALVDQIVKVFTYLVMVIALIPEIMANLPPELWLAALFAPAIVLTIMLALSTLLAAKIADEPLRPTPKMTEITPDGGVHTQGVGDDRYSDTMLTNRRLDMDGGVDATDVEVTAVLDENGNLVSWRVVLPSTQDWQEASGLFGADGPRGDQGGMNDLDSNLALMLTPSQQAAYERAVIQAMLDAGVGPNDPVMLTGWSQGGIMAGKMAADPNSPFNIQAIYVSGAPIDNMNIPDTVSVISVQHTDDPVTKLDSPTQPGYQGPNWYTVTQDPPLDKHGDPMEQHDSLSYAGTGEKYVDNSTDPRLNDIKEKQDMFYSDNEVVRVYEGSEEPVPLVGQR